jgi:hypothetical protein
MQSIYEKYQEGKLIENNYIILYNIIHVNL